MHIALVPGVEDDRIPRRMEHAVHCEREFDDPQVRTEVAAGLRDLANEKLADLVGEGLEFLRGQCIEIARRPDAVKQAH